jgi:multiple sugar transport system substrate-binding protein
MGRGEFLKASGLAGAALLGSGALAGCAGGGQEQGGENTIAWQVIPQYSTQADDTARVEYVKKAISSFNESGKFDIRERVSSSDITAANARLLEQASQNRAPDIAMVDSYLFPRFYDFARPVGEFLGDVSLDSYFPFAADLMTGPGDEVLGLQFTTDVRVLFYRSDLLDEAPSSWDDVLRVGRQVRGEAPSPFLFPAGRDEATMTTTLLPLFWSQGGTLTDDGGDPVFGEGSNRDAMLNALGFIQRCVQSGITPKRVTEYGLETDLNGDVASGQVAMFLGGNFQVGLLQDIVGAEKFLDQWAVAPIPSESGSDFATTAGGQMWGVFTEDEERRRTAVDFLVKNYVGDEGMAGWCNIGGYLPPRRPVFDVPAYKGNKYTDTFRQHLNDYARSRPASESYQDISTALQVAVTQVVSGESDPERALETAVRTVSGG